MAADRCLSDGWGGVPLEEAVSASLTTDHPFEATENGSVPVLIDVDRRPGYTRRRYIGADGKVQVTYEVPFSFVHHVGLEKFRDVLDRIERGKARQKRAAYVRMHVTCNIARSSSQLAKELGVTEARIRQVKQELRALGGKDGGQIEQRGQQRESWP